ncbi:MAG: hypothetical protein L3J91_00630, partial [Thermoplasmata archaeon]|nr:hypothetical protein [Thermoplasmata archaeon]
MAPTRRISGAVLRTASEEGSRRTGQRGSGFPRGRSGAAAVIAGVVLLLLLPTLVIAGDAGAAPAPPTAPAGAASAATALRGPAGPSLADAFSISALRLPGLGPHPDTPALPAIALPSSAPTGRAAPVLPELPASLTTAGIYRPSPGGPTDINLSGNSTLQVASDTTVLNVSLYNHSILYVHSPSIRVTLQVLGNIHLYGQSLLFVNASNLAIGESYDVQWSLQVVGASEFAVAYSNVTTNGYQWGAAYEQSANITIVSSLIGYPTDWLDSDLVGAPKLTVYDSWYSSDVILFDNALAPSTANFTAVRSAGFNVWLNFKAGAMANLSLPGIEGWRNWTFPGAAQVTGLNYSVDLVDCFVLVFAVMLWQGANLTLVNSPDVALSLNIDSGTVNVTGLSESLYAHYGLYSDQFALTLINTTMFTWNIYTFSGNVQIDRSQVGEIQVFGSTWAVVQNSTLTAHGGYYGNQGSAQLTIVNSTIAGQVVAYSGLTSLVRCSVNTTTPNRLLATGAGHLSALDTRLAAVDSYQALGGGTIDVAWTVHVNVTSSAAPVPGASVSLLGAANG